MAVKRMIFLSLLTAMALVVSLIEQSFPLPIGIPGAKLGISNIIILVTLVLYGFRAALVVAVLKSVLLMLITGSITSFWYSLVGAVLSAVIMAVIFRFFTPTFSLIGVSEFGALAHNVGQLFVAMIVLDNPRIFYYLPVLTLIGVFSGYFVGLSTNYLTKHLKRVGHLD